MARFPDPGKTKAVFLLAVAWGLSTSSNLDSRQYMSEEQKQIINISRGVNIISNLATQKSKIFMDHSENVQIPAALHSFIEAQNNEVRLARMIAEEGE